MIKPLVYYKLLVLSLTRQTHYNNITSIEDNRQSLYIFYVKYTDGIG